MAYGIYESGQVIAQFVAPVSVISNKPVYASDTLSLSRPTNSRTAQRWEIETRLEPLSSSANDLFVNLVINGYSEAVQVVMPQNYGVIKNRTSTSTGTVNTHSAGTNVVSITSPGYMPKGTFIRFSNHTKIYMTVTDHNSGSVTIYPALTDGVTNGNTVYRGDDVIGTFVYDFDTITGMAFTDGILQDVGIVKLLEYL